MERRFQQQFDNAPRQKSSKRWFRSDLSFFIDPPIYLIFPGKPGTLCDAADV